MSSAPPKDPPALRRGASTTTMHPPGGANSWPLPCPCLTLRLANHTDLREGHTRQVRGEEGGRCPGSSAVT